MLLVQMVLQLLTGSSWQTWILPTLEHHERDFDIHRHRPNIDIHTDDVNRQLDRVPDPCGRWPRLWFANGRCPFLENNEETLLGLANIFGLSPS